MVIGLCKECSTEIGVDDKNMDYGRNIYQCPNCGTLQDINEIEPCISFRVKERRSPKKKPNRVHWK